MTYFDDVAEKYDAASLAWPWSWLRKVESEAFLSVAGDLSNTKVLDLGSGTGYYTKIFLKLGAQHVTAVDASRQMIATLGDDARITGLVGNAEDVRLEEKFQFISCAGLLEFVANPVRVLQTARHHADAQTKLVILVPRNNPWGNCYRYFHHRHGLDISLFGESKIYNLAAETGWQICNQRQVWPFTYIANMMWQQ